MIAAEDSVPLTISSLAREAKVSRRTLYVHWQTMEELTSEALADVTAPAIPSRQTGSLEERLRTFLRETRDHLKGRLPKIAAASAAYFATTDDTAFHRLKEVQQQRLNLFRATVSPITADQFAQIVGPIYFSELHAGRPASPDLVASQLAMGVALLEADKTAGSQT